MVFRSVCLVSACLLHIGTASMDRSAAVEPRVDVPMRLAKLKNLPKEYFCCKEGEHLIGGDSNKTCADLTGKSSNISLSCPKIFTYSATLDIWSKYEFYVENEVLVFGDHKYMKSEISPKGICFANTTSEKLQAVECMDALDVDQMESMRGIYYAYAYLTIVSTIFLILTLIVYSLLSELRDLYGQSLICLCATYTIALIMKSNSIFNYHYQLNTSLCHAGGLIEYYCMMSTFCWMNAISLQIYIGLRYPNLALTTQKQFQLYSCYCWGVPTVLLLCVMIAQVAPGDHVLPMMGNNFRCWFNGEAAKWAYFWGPMTFLFICNVLLYVASAVVIFRQSSGDSYRTRRYRFLLSLRLFIVVGITWLLLPIKNAHGKTHVLWIATDFWNILQGVLIFIVAVLLRKRAIVGLTNRGYFYKLTDLVQRWTAKLSGDEDVEAVVASTGEGDINVFYSVTIAENDD